MRERERESVSEICVISSTHAPSVCIVQVWVGPVVQEHLPDGNRINGSYVIERTPSIGIRALSDSREGMEKKIDYFSKVQDGVCAW